MFLIALASVCATEIGRQSVFTHKTLCMPGVAPACSATPSSWPDMDRWVTLTAVLLTIAAGTAPVGGSRPNVVGGAACPEPRWRTLQPVQVRYRVLSLWMPDSSAARLPSGRSLADVESAQRSTPTPIRARRTSCGASTDGWPRASCPAGYGYEHHLQIYLIGWTSPPTMMPRRAFWAVLQQPARYVEAVPAGS